MKAEPMVIEIGEASRVSSPKHSNNRGISIADLILRIVGVIGTFASAIAMGTTDETLPFSTQLMSFRAQYDDLPSFRFFVIANSIVCGYLAMSILPSIFHIVRSEEKIIRIILIFFDTAMMALLTAGASAAAAIVYLAHQGNASANWSAICQQFNNFCDSISGSLIGSFCGIVVFIMLIFFSGLALSRC